MTTQMQLLCPVAPLTVETHTHGLQTAERYGMSVCDGMIVASARLSGCAMLFTEDMQDGQVIDGQLTIHNPFMSR